MTTTNSDHSIPEAQTLKTSHSGKHASDESESTPILRARNLLATGHEGTIFGPIDVDLNGGDLCIVHGDKGSGKSALLLTLSGRFRGVTGTLLINGIDALESPYEAIDETTVARLGNYVAPEDRLTIAESIAERAYLDRIPLREAEDRAEEIENLLGFRVERGVEIEQLDPVTRAITSVALAMLRPAQIVVVDDIDLVVPHSQQPRMFELLHKLTTLDQSVIIASAIDADTVPKGTMRIRLSSKIASHTHPIDDAPVTIDHIDSDPVVDPDPDQGRDTSEPIVQRVGSDDEVVKAEEE